MEAWPLPPLKTLNPQYSIWTIKLKSVYHFLDPQILPQFMDLYRRGETGDTVFQKMAKQRKKHREGAVFGPIDHSKKSYSRKRNFAL